MNDIPRQRVDTIIAAPSRISLAARALALVHTDLPPDALVEVRANTWETRVELRFVDLEYAEAMAARLEFSDSHIWDDEIGMHAWVGVFADQAFFITWHRRGPQLGPRAVTSHPAMPCADS